MQKKHSGTSTPPPPFESVPAADVPHDRKGKHNALVSQILSSLMNLPHGNALKIPLLDLRKQKVENVRSAVNRAGKKINLQIATSCDDYFFYVWISNKNTFRN